MADSLLDSDTEDTEQVLGFEQVLIDAFEPLYWRLAGDYDLTEGVDDDDYPGVLTSQKRGIPQADGHLAFVHYPNRGVGTWDTGFLADARELVSFATSYPVELLVSTGIAQTIREFLELIERVVSNVVSRLALRIEDAELERPDYPYSKSSVSEARESVGFPSGYYLSQFDKYMDGTIW